MAHIKSIKYYFANSVLLMAVFYMLFMVSACRKTEYNMIDQAAYLRVFNSLNYDVNVSSKDYPPPFLTMVIDPKYDASGMITGGEVVGDFLDRRSAYAPPYPDKAGNTDYKNTEYPGRAKVLVAPIVNGIDLSSWAQIKPGKHRVVFYSRPVNPTPFFSLAPGDRHNLISDNTIDLASGEVYTMEVLQKDIKNPVKLSAALYTRKEEFTKTSFSNALVYVNFYNLSAEGYADANPGPSPNGDQDYYDSTNKTRPFGDDMNIFFSLFTTDTEYPYSSMGSNVSPNLIPGFNNIQLGRLVRSQSGGLAPYYSIPMFAGADTSKRILSRQWELFTLLSPKLTPVAGPVAVISNFGMADANIDFGAIGCSNISNDGKGVIYSVQKMPKVGFSKFVASAWLPNLIKYTASGKNQQQSFATISTIEIINNQVYMMSVQRSFPPPADSN